MRKLYRSATDKQISGLCGGLAQYFGIDATAIRLIAVVAVFFSFGTVTVLYLLGSLIVPKEPTADLGYDNPFSGY